MNLTNIYAGLIGFVLAAGFSYATWNTIETMLTSFPTELHMLGTIGHFLVTVFSILLLPIALATSDDKGVI